MVHYYIEFRFQGKSKHEMKKLSYEVNRRFNLRHARRRRPIPHITLIRPFYTKNQRRLVGDFKSVCSKYDLIKFKLKGYGFFDKSRVVFINIVPSKEMVKFRQNIIRKLKLFCNLSNINSQEYKPHTTIAMKLTPSQFGKIKSYIRKKRKPSQDYVMARATLIKGQKILYEYDFLLGKLLNRKEAKSRRTYTKTLNKIKGLDKNQTLIAKDISVWEKLKKWFGIK